MAGSRFQIWVIAIASAACTVAAVRPAHAQRIPRLLMVTDGQSANNITKAQRLGFETANISMNGLLGLDGSKLYFDEGFDVLFISCNMSAAAYDKLRIAVKDNGVISKYVAVGGKLVINIAGNQGSQADIAPGGVDFDATYFHDTEQFGAPDHPYLTGQYYYGNALEEADFIAWQNTDHGNLTGFPEEAIVILSNRDGVSLVEYPYGYGTVVVTTLTYGWGQNGAKAEPQENLIKWIAISPEPGTLSMLAIAAGIVLRRRRNPQP